MSPPEAMLPVIETLLGEVTSRYSCASVRPPPTPRPPNAPDFTLECSVPNTASVSILVLDDDEVEVSLGRDTMMEFIGVKRRRELVIDRIRQLLEGVAEGRFEETVWEIGPRIVRSQGVIELVSGDTLKSSQATLLGWLWPWGKRRIRYESYQ